MTIVLNPEAESRGGVLNLYPDLYLLVAAFIARNPSTLPAVMPPPDLAKFLTTQWTERDVVIGYPPGKKERTNKKPRILTPKTSKHPASFFPFHKVSLRDKNAYLGLTNMKGVGENTLAGPSVTAGKMSSPSKRMRFVERAMLVLQVVETDWVRDLTPVSPVAQGWGGTGELAQNGHRTFSGSQSRVLVIIDRILLQYFIGSHHFIQTVGSRRHPSVDMRTHFETAATNTDMKSREGNCGSCSPVDNTLTRNTLVTRHVHCAFVSLQLVVLN